MEHINWRRVLSLAGLLMVLALLLRGCLYACEQKGGGQAGIDVTDSRRTVSVYVDDTDRVEQMQVEEYLVGVVAAEMPAGFNMEALKAQAVAARTYTYKRIADGGCTHNAQLCTDSTCCQAYNSDARCREKWGAAYAENIAKVSEAVRATTGEVLYYKGALIEALYHSSSGGKTEDSENVFASARPYLRSVESAYEIGSNYLTAEADFSRDEFARLINKAWSKAKLKASSLEKQVEVKERFKTGRVKSVRLGNVTVTGRELRGVLELRSAWFTLEVNGDGVVIDTRGYGHGVGMSQAGANGMAAEGKNYREILTHYYTGVQLAAIKA